MLLAEDDLAFAEFLRAGLKPADYVVEWTDNSVDAEFLALQEHFDGITLDLGLPQKPGLEVLQSWCEKQLDTPVLTLVARDSWRDRVDGLKAGADF